VSPTSRSAKTSFETRRRVAVAVGGQVDVGEAAAGLHDVLGAKGAPGTALIASDQRAPTADVGDDDLAAVGTAMRGRT
jgi:hypothetical protein